MDETFDLGDEIIEGVTYWNIRDTIRQMHDFFEFDTLASYAFAPIIQKTNREEGVTDLIRRKIFSLLSQVREIWF